MDTLNLLLALVLPSVLGAQCVAWLFPAPAPGRAVLILGYGILFGLLTVAMMLRVLDASGIVLTFFAGATPLALLVLAFACLQFFQRGSTVTPRTNPGAFGLSRPQLALFVFFLILIDLRILSLALELVWRPLFPWDATMHWATKARVWFDAQAIVPFVDNLRWLELGGEGVYTDHHPGYPITTPLLQLWLSLALGRWDESLMNLPWLLCLTGLALAFYGQARAAGGSALTAIIFTYLLVSLPLLNTHVALAGYSDLFLGAFYAAALMAFHNWSVSRQPAQAVLALVFALYCPLIKNEGFFWLLTFLPALVVVLLPWRRAMTLLCGAVLILVLLLAFLPPDLVIAGNSLGDLKLKFHTGVFSGIATSIWVQDNWHLLGFLLPALTFLILLSGRGVAARYRGIGVALLSAIALLLSLFLFTRHSLGAVRFSSLGRISLQLVPSLMFLAMLFWQDVSRRQLYGRFRHVPAQDEVPPPSS